MLRLTKRVEFEEVRIGNTSFRPRLVSYSAHRCLIRENTHAGRLNEDDYDRALWRFLLGPDERPADKPGWTHLADEDGKELAYDGDAVAHVVGRLSKGPIELVLTAALLPKRVHQEQEKNSNASSGNEAAGTTPSQESSDEEA